METKNVWISGIIAVLTMTGGATYFILHGVDIDQSNCQLLNNSKVLIQVCPKSIPESTYVYGVFNSKQFSGDLDFAFGFDSRNARIVSSDIYLNNTVNESGGNISVWRDYNLTEINYSYDGKDLWYVARHVPIIAGRDYLVRFYVDVVPGTSGKYDVALKPSAETIQQAVANGHFYFLDPWWNSTTGGVNTNCTVNWWSSYNNGSSTTSVGRSGELRNGLLYEPNILAYYTADVNGSFPSEKCNYIGTISGAKYITPGKINGAYNFTSASSNYVSVAGATPLHLNKSITISFWIKKKSYADYHQIIDYSSTAWAGYFRVLNYADGHYLFSRGNNLNAEDTLDCLNTTSDTTNWRFIVFTINSSNIGKCYINGKLMNTDTVNSYSGGGTTLYIGRYYTATRYANMYLDELQILNRSISWSEVNQSYNLGSGLRYNSSANKFYSKINTTASNINWIVATFNCTNAGSNTCKYRISTDNRTTFTPWLTTANNSQNISVTTGRWLSFDINVTGNATYTPKVFGLGMTSGYTNPSINATLGNGVTFSFTPDPYNFYQENVTPPGQTDSVGLLYVCNNGSVFGNVQMNMTTSNQVYLYCDDDNTKAGAVNITSSLQTIKASLTGGSCAYIWCWADYNGLSSLFQPDVWVVASG